MTAGTKQSPLKRPRSRARSKNSCNGVSVQQWSDFDIDQAIDTERLDTERLDVSARLASDLSTMAMNLRFQLESTAHARMSGSRLPNSAGDSAAFDWLGPESTFDDPNLERDFISFCQLACPVTTAAVDLEAKREELLDSAATYIWQPEFDMPNADQFLCDGTLLEPAENLQEPAISDSIEARMYANLCSTRLLGTSEETRVLKRMHYFKFIAHKLLQADVLDQWLLTRAEALIQAANWHRCLVIQANMRLVVSIVRRLPVTPSNYDELVSDGIIGLLRALEKFDPSRGYRFCTYATPVIRRECYQHMQTRRDDRSKCTQSTALSILASVKGLADSNAESKAERAHWLTWRRKLSGLIDHLSRREQVIIRSRYCLGAHKHVKTLQRLADALKISKERVRQLEHNALSKLRKLAGEL